MRRRACDTGSGWQALPAALAADRDAAFPHLVRALIDGVYSGALRLTGSRADAEDVTQEAFLRAYRALGAYPPERIRELRLREWVWTIAANLCRNRARSRQRHPEEALPAEAAAGRPGARARGAGPGRRRRASAWRPTWPASPGRSARRWCCATSPASPTPRSPPPWAAPWAP